MTTIVIVGDITPEAARARSSGPSAAGRQPDRGPISTCRQVPPNKPADTRGSPRRGERKMPSRFRKRYAIDREEPDYLSAAVGERGAGRRLLLDPLLQGFAQEHGLGVLDRRRRRCAGGIGPRTTWIMKLRPKNVPRARAIIDRDLDARCAASLVTPQEVADAKSRSCASIPLSYASVDGIVRRRNCGTPGSGLALDEADQAMRNLRPASRPQQIRSAFARWIEPWRFVQVTTGPAGP